MLFFLLDGLINGVQWFLGSVFTFLVQAISFAELFIFVFNLFQGFVLERWHYSELLVGIIIMIIAGPLPGITLIAGQVPDFSNLV